jgi:hypothetical protein
VIIGEALYISALVANAAGSATLTGRALLAALLLANVGTTAGIAGLSSAIVKITWSPLRYGILTGGRLRYGILTGTLEG